MACTLVEINPAAIIDAGFGEFALGARVSKSFPPGTVVVAIVGATIGATAILGITTYAPDSVIGIQPDPKQCTPEYIEYLLRFWKPIFRARAPETARANINLETITPVPVPLPPIELQRQFSLVYRTTIDLKRKLRSGTTDLNNS